MTNREFYSAIARGEISPEIQEHAEMLLAKMDEQNAKRKSVMTKKQQENEAVKQEIVRYLQQHSEGAVAAEIGEALEISTQKALALCRQLVSEEKIRCEEVAIPKVGVRKKYYAV